MQIAKCQNNYAQCILMYSIKFNGLWSYRTRYIKRLPMYKALIICGIKGGFRHVNHYISCCVVHYAMSQIGLHVVLSLEWSKRAIEVLDME